MKWKKGKIEILIIQKNRKENEVNKFDDCQDYGWVLRFKNNYTIYSLDVVENNIEVIVNFVSWEGELILI